MPRPPRTIEAEEVERLASIRQTAATTRAATIAQGPDPANDILGAIAWRWTILGDDAPELADLIEAAVTEHRLSWKEIGAACDVNPDDQLAVEAFAAARRRRRRP